MTSMPRMDISIPSSPVTPVAETRPRVESVLGVTAATEQVSAGPKSETADNKTGGGKEREGSAPQAGHSVYYDRDIKTFIQLTVDSDTGQVLHTYPDQASIDRMARLAQALGKTVDTES